MIRVLYWGDELELENLEEANDPKNKYVKVRIYNTRKGEYVAGTVRKRSDPKKRRRYLPIRFREGENPHLLEVTFIDVQQGDATLVRTPDRKTLLIDGGEGKFVARYLAAMFPETSLERPFIFDTLVVTHGDADHFKGLCVLADASKLSGRKRFVARVARYYHNGLVKLRGTKTENGTKKKRRAKERYGAYIKEGRKTYAIELFDDPRLAAQMNRPFKVWAKALNILLDEAGLEHADRNEGESLPRVSRIEFGQDDAFEIFRKSGVFIEVLGPITDQIQGNVGLPFLRGGSGGISASHTINGHSVVLKLTYKNVDFMLGGDLNEASEQRLLTFLKDKPSSGLRSLVLKAPHHGSHDFNQDFLEAVNPLISVVSSGDESVMKEYIHPRANLMAALGRSSRGPMPLLFSTELAAFFAERGYIKPESHRREDGALKSVPKKDKRGAFWAFERLAWGAVFMRSNGERITARLHDGATRK